MTIVIRGIGTGSEFRARVLAEMQSVLAKARVQPTTTTIVFTDENGPKGGVANCCAVTAAVPRQATAARRVACRHRTARVRQGHQGVGAESVRSA